MERDNAISFWHPQDKAPGAMDALSDNPNLEDNKKALWSREDHGMWNRAKIDADTTK